jgi:hypothetical protein
MSIKINSSLQMKTTKQRARSEPALSVEKISVPNAFGMLSHLAKPMKILAIKNARRQYLMQKFIAPTPSLPT